MKPGETNDPFSARILSAGKKDGPTKDQVSRAVAAALASTTLVAAVTPPPRPTLSLGGPSIVKLGLGVVGVSLIGVVAYSVLSPSPAATPPAPMTSAAPSAVETPLAPVATERTISVSDLPSAATPLPLPPPRPLPSTTPLVAEAPPSLRDELLELSAARTALRDGDAPRALTHLASYRRSFPHGVLRAEEAALRIDAELATGDVASAKADAARFATEFQTSQEAPRIRALRESLEAR